jgi:hypothetical protein
VCKLLLGVAADLKEIITTKPASSLVHGLPSNPSTPVAEVKTTAHTERAADSCCRSGVAAASAATLVQEAGGGDGLGAGKPGGSRTLQAMNTLDASTLVQAAACSGHSCRLLRQKPFHVRNWFDVSMHAA